MSAQAAAGAVPAFLAQDKATREWLAHYDHTSRNASWHPADVEWTLGEAHRLLRSLGGRIGPASAKGFWPAIVPDPGEYREGSKARRAEASEVTLMNFALGWAWTYLSEEAPERRAIQDWCYCKEFGLSLRTFYKERSLHRTTEQLHRRRGLLFIAARLCRAGVPVPRDVLIARLEGKRSELRDDVDALAQAARDGTLAAQEAPQAAVQPVRAPVRRAPPIAELWRACEAAQALGAGAFVDAVFGLIFERTRAEAEAGDIAPAALSDRSARLTAEAIRRGLLPENARPRLTMGREELTARIESNREAAPAGEGSHA